MQFFLHKGTILIIAILGLNLCQIVPILKRRVETSQQLQMCLPPIGNTNNKISVGNCNGYQYQIQVGIGTPPQYFLFQFDTGSNVLWVPTTSALGSGFNTSASSTCNITNQTSKVQYADNSQASGYTGTEFVTVLPIPIYVRSNILFVVQQNDMKFNGGVIGILGMGYTTNNNFLDIAYSAGIINTSTFALQLLSTQSQSYLYYNNIPQNITNNTLYSSVSNSLTSQSRWQVEVVGFYAGDNDWTSYAANSAIIDSGTSLFYLNTNLFTQFYNTYLQNCTNKTNFYICHCTAGVVWPNLIFMFAGVQVQINSSDYVIPSAGSGQCDVYIGELATVSTQILLGDTLFQNYIITFNKIAGQIGFSGNGVVSVPVFGGDYSFQTAEYALLGINVFLALWLLLLWCIIFSKKAQPTLRQPFNINMNKQIYAGNHFQMKPQNPMQINYY